MTLFTRFASLSCLLLIFSFRPLAAQQPPGAGAVNPISSAYELGSGDQLSIHAPNAEELSDKPFRIDSEGFVSLPLIGRFKAASLRVNEFESDVTNRLRVFFKNPQVSVSVLQARPEPVFLVGAFKNPGVYSLQTQRTLFQVIAAAGGLQSNAGRRIRVTRRKSAGALPLQGAKVNLVDESSTVEIALAGLQTSITPEEDISLQPFDVVSVDRAEVIYVDGEVTRPGPVELGERNFVPLTQVVSLSGGLTKDASQRVRVLRTPPDSSSRQKIDVDLGRILAGKADDFRVLPNDVLYIPRAQGRMILNRASATGIALALSMAAAMAIAR